MIEHVNIGQIFFIRPAALRSPGISKGIGHPAEILDRRALLRARIDKAENFRSIIGQNIHHDDRIREIKRCIACVQGFQQPGSGVEFSSKRLSTIDTAVSAAGAGQGTSARQAATIFTGGISVKVCIGNRHNR